VRLVAIVSLLVFAPAPARAESWVELAPRVAYEIHWSHAAGHRASIDVTVERADRYPLGRWLQVAPGDKAVALRGADTGLVVYSPSGASLFSRRAVVTAFRFSPDGERVAFAGAKGLELVRLDHPEARVVADLAGIDWIRFTDAGLLVRAGGKLALVDEQGKVRTLASGRIDAVAAAGARIAYFGDGALVSMDPAHPDRADRTALADKSPVLDAELSPNGHDLLWSTRAHVYLCEGNAPARVVVDGKDIIGLSFSPDGSAWLWSSSSAGALVTAGAARPLPTGYGRAAFRAGGRGVVALSSKRVAVWDPAKDTTTVVGGVDPAETELGLVVMVGDELIFMTARTPPGLKEHSTPDVDRPVGETAY